MLEGEPMGQQREQPVQGPSRVEVAIDLEEDGLGRVDDGGHEAEEHAEGRSRPASTAEDLR
jgi:hypothetical protein